jgi:hypothetical protein
MLFDVRIFQLLVLARGICLWVFYTDQFALLSHLGSHQLCEDVVGPGSRFKGKHSLDSDEEDEEEDGDKSSKYNILASDDVEGLSYPFDCLHN